MNNNLSAWIEVPQEFYSKSITEIMALIDDCLCYHFEFIIQDGKLYFTECE